MFSFQYIEPHPPTNLSAVVQCSQGYEIQIDWLVNTECNYLIQLSVLTLYSLFVSKHSLTPRQLPNFCHIMYEYTNTNFVFVYSVGKYILTTTSGTCKLIKLTLLSSFVL